MAIKIKNRKILCLKKNLVYKDDNFIVVKSHWNGNTIIIPKGSTYNNVENLPEYIKRELRKIVL